MNPPWRQNETENRRVVVTGMGVVSPAGFDLNSLWQAVSQGRSACDRLTKFDVDSFPAKMAAEVKDFDPGEFVEFKKARRLDHSILFSIAAAKLAFADSGLLGRRFDHDRTGVVEATSVCGMETTFKWYNSYQTRGYKGISPFTLINAYNGGGSGEVAIELGINGHAFSYSSSSASGSDVVGYGHMMIRQDEADVMLVGGAESPLIPPLWGAFCQAQLLSLEQDDPGAAMKPFSKDRGGFILGEGAAYLVLEELSHALQRNARIYAEVVSHGRSCESYHSVVPHPGGKGLEMAIRRAVKRAGIRFEDIDYINAHGTATQINDPAEVNGIKAALGPHSMNAGISSTKPVTGHLLAAAGALESVICILAIQNQMMPATINLEQPDPECNLDFIPKVSRPYPIRTALNLSIGFGGKNSCLIFSKYPSTA